METAIPNIAPAEAGSGRLKALDIMRGITIAGMILVNNPGSWGHIYTPLEHAAWHGLTPTDLVFPFFMFIMGMSMCLSLSKYDFKPGWYVVAKTVRRTVLIFAIGLGLAWLAKTLRGGFGGTDWVAAATDFAHLRLLGVLPRLALCYGVGALIVLSCKRKTVGWIAALLLIGYAVTLLVADGLDFTSHNIVARVDRAVLGVDHMYTDEVDGVALKFDPEGLLSTIPSIAHTLIGFLCGGILLADKDNYRRVARLSVIGSCMMFAGLLLSYGMPISKKLWTPTFVLTTCGMAAALLGVLIYVIDIKGRKRWCVPFEAFGVNPLFMFVLGSIGGTLMGVVPVNANQDSLHHLLYSDLLVPLCGGSNNLSSLLYALIYVTAIWLVGYVLYKKKIYIKI